MTKDQFDAAYRGFCKRHPLRPFLIEFTSGNQLLIGHPEAVRDQGELYVMRSPDGGNIVFAAESVTRLLDVPTATAKRVSCLTALSAPPIKPSGNRVSVGSYRPGAGCWLTTLHEAFSFWNKWS